MRASTNEVEKLFHSDIKEKKIIGRGIHSVKGKRGYVGKMKFVTDFMSRKEKYNYRKGGKVLSYNVYDKILKKDEYDKLDDSQQKVALEYWRENFSMTQIKNEMGIASNTLYSYIDKFNLPKSKRKKRSDNKSKKAKSSIKNKNTSLNDADKQGVTDAGEGLSLEYKADYNGDQIQKIFEKLSLLLDGEENKYHLSIKLQEK